MFFKNTHYIYRFFIKLLVLVVVVICSLCCELVNSYNDNVQYLAWFPDTVKLYLIDVI